MQGFPSSLPPILDWINKPLVDNWGDTSFRYSLITFLDSPIDQRSFIQGQIDID